MCCNIRMLKLTSLWIICILCSLWNSIQLCIYVECNNKGCNHRSFKILLAKRRWTGAFPRRGVVILTLLDLKDLGQSSTFGSRQLKGKKNTASSSGLQIHTLKNTSYVSLSSKERKLILSIWYFEKWAFYLLNAESHASLVTLCSIPEKLMGDKWQNPVQNI